MPPERPRSSVARRKPDARTRSWGSVARRGANELREPSTDYVDVKPSHPPEKHIDQWIDEGRVDDDIDDDRPKRPSNKSRRGDLPPEVIDEVSQVVGSGLAKRVLSRLSEATYAFQRERWDDARSTLSPLVKQYPDVVAIRELHGLVLYRMERWKSAAKEFEAVAALSGALDQYPVMADCYRALKRHGEVERLWEQLRQGGVGIDILTEGRIVTAGSRAENGKIKDAIRLLEEGPVSVRKPREHHLRLWYALASTYEQAGDVPRARGLFKQLRTVAPDFADVDERLANLS